jgi:hypothetical protein
MHNGKNYLTKWLIENYIAGINKKTQQRYLIIAAFFCALNQINLCNSKRAFYCPTVVCIDNRL